MRVLAELGSAAAGCPHAALAAKGGTARKLPPLHEHPIGGENNGAVLANYDPSAPQAVHSLHGAPHGPGGSMVSTAHLLNHGPTDAEVAARIAADVPEEWATRLLANDMPKELSELVRDRVHRELAAVFAPISDDLHREVAKLHTMPLDDIPLAGGPTEVGPHVSSLAHREARLAVDFPSDRSLIEPVDEIATSVQVVPGRPHNAALDIVVPVSEFGAPMAKALVNAARAMNAATLNLRPALDDVTRKYENLLTTWTFQHNALRTTMVGNSTYAGAFSVLASKNHGGAMGAAALQNTADALRAGTATIDADGTRTLKAILESHMLDRGAKGPIGVFGPMVFQGFLPKEAVAVAGTRFKYSPAMTTIDRDTRHARTNGGHTPQQAMQTHRGCPVAVRNLTVERPDGPFTNPETYIHTIGDDFLQLAKRFYERELADAAASAGGSAVDAAKTGAATVV